MKIQTILNAMTSYATGQLTSLESDELRQMQDVVIEKIAEFDTLVRCNDMTPDLRTDLRTYQTIREVIAVELESRANAKPKYKLQPNDL